VETESDSTGQHDKSELSGMSQCCHLLGNTICDSIL